MSFNHFELSDLAAVILRVELGKTTEVDANLLVELGQNIIDPELINRVSSGTTTVYDAKLLRKIFNQ
jgi:hypothetical protein